MTQRLTPMFRDETELASFIKSVINVRASAVVAPLSTPDKPLGCDAREQLIRLVNDSGRTQGQVAKGIGVPKSTLNGWMRKPESLTLERFISIATYCAKASSGTDEKEDAFERNLEAILLVPMDARDERKAMREAAIRRIGSIVKDLSDCNLATLLDVAVALATQEENVAEVYAEADHCVAPPPSLPLRESSERLRTELEQARREECAAMLELARKKCTE